LSPNTRISFGGTKKLREWGGYDDVVNCESGAYAVGTYAGQAVDIGLTLAVPVTGVTSAARGVTPTRRRLFVIDGATQRLGAIDAVFGAANPVQRCRRHKERNVLGYLPEDDRDHLRRVLKAAWKLPAAKGLARLEKEAKALEKAHPSAAASLREGLEEMFTVSRLGLPPLCRSLCSTNLIESPFSGARSCFEGILGAGDAGEKPTGRLA